MCSCDLHSRPGEISNQPKQAVVEVKSAVVWRKVLLVLKVILRYWRLKFFLFGPEKSSKEGLEVATPENLKWKNA